MDIMCNKCGTPHTIEIKNFNEVGRDTSRPFGDEIAYTGGVYHKCDCETMLTFAFDLWEYPKGEVNYTETRMDNCVVQKEPDYLKLI